MIPYLLITGDFTKTGGMDRANHALAMHLASLGHEVHLVGYRADADLLDLPNVVFHPVKKLAGSYLLSAPWLDRVGRRWSKHIHARGGRVITNGGVCPSGDVNWVHYLHAAYKPQLVGSRLRRIKNALHHKHSLSTERRALKRASIIITNSERTRRDIVTHYKIDPARVAVVHLAADVARFTPRDANQRDSIRQALGWPANKKIGVFIGAMGDRRKGFDTLFAAWKSLCDDASWDMHLAVVGAGSEVPAWQARATEAGMGDRLSFLGFRSDVPDILGAADLIIAPTRYEAYGLSVHEAFCCGLPAIVSRDAGVSEIVPEGLKNLMLLPNPDDSDNLKAMLQTWCREGEHYRAAIDAFCRQVGQRTWQTCCKEIVQRIDGLSADQSPANLASNKPHADASAGTSLQRSV